MMRPYSIIFVLLLIITNPNLIKTISTQINRQEVINSLKANEIDLTLVGFYIPEDGLGKIVQCIADMLEGEAQINWRTTRDVRPNTIGIDQHMYNVITNPSDEDGKIAILTDLIWIPSHDQYSSIPKNSFIKMAYSMLECTAIPQEWVQSLNDGFDAVIVPDPWLVNVYKNSGVNIPIFTLPLGVHIQEFLSNPLKLNPSEVFTFGNTSGSWIHKNQVLLIDAFAHAFGNNPKVKLVINSRGCDPKICSLVYQAIEKWNLKNIEFNVNSLSRQEYVKLLCSFNAYVSLSKGEGYAIIPREAMAAGIPTILSNNTAHTTLCQSGLGYSVNSNLLEPADYGYFKNPHAYFYNCDLSDAVNALLEVYNNYKSFLEKASHAREWVKRYSIDAPILKSRYKSLIKPTYIRLEDSNRIEPKGIITSDKKLYNKYKLLIESTQVAAS